MPKRILLLFVLLGLLFAAPARAGIPDLFSGSWPAKLMPSNQRLGTITWRPISEQWGRSVLFQPWGGAPFTTCPPAGQTRFFLGQYTRGGKLIACTVGPGGTELHGRYDGSGMEFAPGSFDVSIVTPLSDPEREFQGVYVEAGGFTTQWCGELIPSSTPDLVAPTATALPSIGVRGRAVRLRLLASDNRNVVRVTATIRRGRSVVATIRSGFRQVHGAPMTLVWRPRKRLHGVYLFTVRAYDRWGNASAPSSATLRLT